MVLELVLILGTVVPTNMCLRLLHAMGLLKMSLLYISWPPNAQALSSVGPCLALPWLPIGRQGSPDAVLPRSSAMFSQLIYLELWDSLDLGHKFIPYQLVLKCKWNKWDKLAHDRCLPQAGASGITGHQERIFSWPPLNLYNQCT